MQPLENPDLLAGIIDDPEDDVRRLVYADWLEENGDPERGQFIRTQCRLAGSSPGAADYPDLLERICDAVAALWVTRMPNPQVPDAIGFYDNWYEERDDYVARYHRGFPYLAQQPLLETAPTVAHARRFREALPQLVGMTTLRGLQFENSWIPFLGEILASQACQPFSALLLHNFSQTATPALARAIADSPAASNLTWLHLFLLQPADVDILANPQVLPRLRRLEVFGPACEPQQIQSFLRSDGMRQVRRIHMTLNPEVSEASVEALARLPELHTLSLRHASPEGIAAMDFKGGFASLERLTFDASDLRGAVAYLAKARLPRLTSLHFDSCTLRNDDLKILLESDLFACLRVLSLQSNVVGDKGVVALGCSPAAKSLRILSLGDNKFGNEGLTAMADAFPNLTTLNLKSSLNRNVSEQDLAQFLAQWSHPRLRHLNLDNWPVGNAGAKAIANNPAFANLTILELGDCQIGPEGAKALFASPHLRNLVKLELTGNEVGDAAETLLDGALPSLCKCYLPFGTTTDTGLKERLKNANRRCFVT